MQLTILIVDDNPEFRMLYGRILQRSDAHDFTVVEAETVAQGLSAARAQKMDCIIIDYQLPDGSAADFMQGLREDPGGSSGAAAILATGRDPEDLSEEAEALGVARCLGKGSLTKEGLLQAVLDAVSASAP